MSASAPDVIGYELERARGICETAGLKVTEVVRVGPRDERSGDGREMVIRQREVTPGVMEFTVSRLWVSPEACAP